MEQWKAIQGYEGYYEVSSCGRIKSLPRKAVRFFEKTGKTFNSQIKGRIMKNGLGTKGYPQTHLRKDGLSKTLEIHRLVAKSFIPLVNGKNQINHIDGNPKNNHISNLEWCTPSENMLHANRAGLRLSQKGSTNTQAILNESKVREIKCLFSLGLSQRNIAKNYGVSHTTIRKIVLNEKWAHVT